MLKLVAGLRPSVIMSGEAGSQAMVESSVAVALAVLRLGTLIQVGVAAWFLSRESDVPGAVWVVTALAVLWSVCYFALVVRRESFLACPWWWGTLDVVVAVVALVVSGLTLPAQWQIGTWLVWAPGYASAVVATVPAWLRSAAGCVGVGAGVGLVYAAITLPSNPSQTLAVINNTLSYVYFTVAALLFAQVARRLARTADENKRRSIELATELEMARYRFHVHNATGVLAQLARDDTPPALLSSLRAQAAQESNRLRQEILAPRTEECGPVPLTAVATAAAAQFGHLPIEMRVNLAKDVCLRQDEALVVQAALVSLLYNIQFHAHASEVIIHADNDGDTWEVSVSDDGAGFDPSTVTYGFGLRSQVLDSLSAKGFHVEIRSAPGEGTLVTIRSQ